MRENAYRVLQKGGVIPAMPLVLDENRKFDEAGQRRLIRYYLEAGADGIAAAVHTTQFEIRLPEHDMLETVLYVAAEEMKAYEERTGRAIVRIAGVCGPTEQAVREAQLAKKLGFDAVLVSPGGLKDKDEEYLIERTSSIAEVMPVVGFYLQPAVGGRVFSYEYWARLCAIENVAAIKCAAFNRYLTIDVARAIACSGREIALYTGNDDSIATDLMTKFSFETPDGTKTVSCVGGLLGHWAVWTHTAVEYFRKIREAAEKGVFDAELLTLAAQITDANAAFFDTRNNFAGCIAGVHEVLRRQGLMKGIWCLNPEETLSLGQSEEIDRVYAMYPALNDDAFVREFLERQ